MEEDGLNTQGKGDGGLCVGTKQGLTAFWLEKEILKFPGLPHLAAKAVSGCFREKWSSVEVCHTVQSLPLHAHHL